jgi:NagD protein
VLVLTGSTRRDQVESFPYRPTRIADSVADLVSTVRELAPSVSAEPSGQPI